MSLGLQNTSRGLSRSYILGIATIAAFIGLIIFAFWVSPADSTQKDAVRLLYIHVPLAVGTYVCFIACALASLGYLIKKTLWWDYMALATAEIGTIFCGLTLVTGAIWGRPIWNTWWEWGDVRLVTTLILFLLFLGYLALRAMPTQSPGAGAKRAAVVALVAVVDIPIINRSVEWWENRTLHQQSTLEELKIEDWTLFTLVLGFLAFSLLIVWLTLQRFRVLWLQGEAEKHALEMAVKKRQEESLL